MNAFTTGALIILYLLLSNAMAAYIESQTVPDENTGECDNINLSGQNTTECQASSGPTFTERVLSVSVTGVNGAPDWFNGFWLVLNVFLLSVAVILIIAYFVGLFFGGAS